MRSYLFAGLLSSLALPALADPCAAPLPDRAGETFSGRVEYVGDGDSLCVRTSVGLVEVRLADFDAPELHSLEGALSKRHLIAISRGKHAVCTVQRGRSGRTVVHDRTIAVCRIGGRTIGDLLRSRGAPSGGR
jgi:endonuclease YncB( thermonuclease family)